VVALKKYIIIKKNKKMKKIIFVFILTLFAINFSNAQSTKIEFKGFKCFEETDEAGEDEMYFVIQVYAKGVLVKQSRFPESRVEYSGIDKGEYTVLNNKNIYDGPIEDIQIVIISRESDRGSILDAVKSGFDLAASALPEELLRYTDSKYVIQQLKKVNSPIADIIGESNDVAIALPSALSEIGSSFKALTGFIYSPGDDNLENKIILLNKAAILNDKKTMVGDLGNTAYNFDSDFINGDGGKYKCYFTITTIPPVPVLIKTLKVFKPNDENIFTEKKANLAVFTKWQKKVLFYNNNSNSATLTNNNDFNTIKQYDFSNWTHITPIGDNELFFYNSNNAVNVVTQSDNYSNAKRKLPLSGGWTSIVVTGADNKVMFFNKTNGNAVLTNKNDFSTITQLTIPNCTDIVSVGNNKLLYYNSTNGAISIVDNTTFKVIKSKTIETYYTHFLDMGNDNILFYNSATGAGKQYNIKKIKPGNINAFSAGWTSIQRIDDNKILFYNTATGLGVVTNATNFENISQHPFSGGWSNIVLIN
jgi:hypothetical protein